MSLNASDSKASFTCSPILVITADGSTRLILFLMQCLHGFATSHSLKLRIFRMLGECGDHYGATH